MLKMVASLRENAIYFGKSLNVGREKRWRDFFANDILLPILRTKKKTKERQEEKERDLVSTKRWADTKRDHLV